ncbi:MAG TPA: VanW family protein [Roseiflexaceae bacterium]|nr:VanW family protein [Roseiflexaceae bacterium]
MSAEQMQPRLAVSAPNTEPLHVSPTVTTHELDERPMRRSRSGGSATRRPPSRHGRGRVLLVTLLAVVVITIIGVASALLYIEQSYSGKIYPNVTIQGMNVGNLTRQEAEAALRSRYGVFLVQPATISFADQVWQPSLAEIGITFDFAGAIDAAYQIGREGGTVDNMRAVSDVRQYGVDLPLQVTFDQSRAQAYLIQIAEQLELPPTDATLRLIGTRIEFVPAQPGRQVLVDATLADLTAGLQRFRPTDVVVQTRDIPPRLGDAAALEARAQIAHLLALPLTLTVDGGAEYAWEPADLASFIEITRVPGTTQDTLQVTLNGDLIEAAITAIADETEQIGTKPRVAWNDGDLKIITPGDPGSRVDEPQARDLAIAALFGDTRAIALPMRATDPPVNEKNLHQLGINELVGVGRSDFTGSADYRITNIGVGMDLLNGILLAPGEEFSFNSYIGAINAANGFVEGYAIIQNRTQLEYGGGICQDSTTLFRAAFWSGLPITERWGHSFYISWYDRYALGPLGNGPGLDATIFTGGPDLKFLNDTGNWLLIQTSSNPRRRLALAEIYGTKLDRDVEISNYRVYDQVPAPTEPVFVADAEQARGSVRQSDRARGGMTIDLYRTITVNGVAQKPELFRTRFRPWPNIFVVNPADMGSDGRPTVAWGDPVEPAPPAETETTETTEQPAPAEDAPTPAEQIAPEEAPAPTG